MGRFTQAVDETVTFDGEQVSFTMRRMQNKHMLKIAPMLAANPGENALARTARLVEASKETLAECVSNFRGLTDSAGNPVTLATAMEEAYFLPLLDTVLGRLLQVSVMQEIEAKKSNAQPPAASSDGSANPTPSAES